MALVIISEFEFVLNTCCQLLTDEARFAKFQTSHEFEVRTRHVLKELTSYDPSIEIDLDPPAQAFPDIAIGVFGVEVKFTLEDKWRSVGNSILETQRVKSVSQIYLIFGKMGGVPEVKWCKYEDSIVHVRTSHVPRFEVEMNTDNPLFRRIGIEYNDFRELPMHEKMKYIRDYARNRLKPGERLWWLSDIDEDEHSIPIQARLYTSLPIDEKIRLRAEATLLCPSVVRSGRSKHKYDDAVLYLLTYHGVICHQARDLFSAGSVANPKNDDKGGIYIQRAIKLIENDMRIAAKQMRSELFLEYWDEDVPPDARISRWLELADEQAQDWKPSECLFLDDNEH